MAERPYGFWFTSVFDLFKFLVQCLIAGLLFYFGRQLANQDAQPQLEVIGAIPQFPADDHFLTVRLKNLSTRMEATVTGVEFVVTDHAFLDRIGQRNPFVNAPPPIRDEHLLKTPTVELVRSDWTRDGRAYRFNEDTDIRIEPGKQEALRLRIGNPSWQPDRWNKAWMNGTLIIHYDNKTVSIPNVNLFHEDCPIVPDIPPRW